MEKRTSKAEQRLREIAEASGETMRNMYQMVQQVYRDEDNFQKQQISLNQNKVNAKQLALMDVQLHNETMREIMLQRKLNRVMWRLRKWEAVKSIFKKKNHGGNKTVNQD